MSFRGNSPYGQSNSQNRQRTPSHTQSNSFLQGWGTPARNFSPKENQSMRSGDGSPRNFGSNSPRHASSYRNVTPNHSSPNMIRFSSPNDRYGQRGFRSPFSPPTPNFRSPFSPPGSTGRNNDRKFHNRYQVEECYPFYLLDVRLVLKIL